MEDRLRSWMQSDLIGVFATIAVVVAVAVTLAAFLIVGPLAGILVGSAVVALSFYLVAKTSPGTAADIADIAPPAAETAQQVLVIANLGLASPELEAELARRVELGPLEVRLLAPAPAPSAIARIADDVGAEAGRAEERVETALSRLSARGISASGSVDAEASPIRCLLDGLRAFPADEVLLVPGDELDWEDAEDLADRIRSETDVRVTELGA